MSKEFRLYIAERLLYFALLIIPNETEECYDLAEFLLKYSSKVKKKLKK